MATIEDLRRNLRAMERTVLAALPDIATTIALSAKAMAERNIKEQGIGEGYSENLIPVWFLEGKELNASGRAYIAKRQGKGKKKKKGEEPDPNKGVGTWGDFRAAQGLQKNHKDLSYSNKMFAGMQPGEPEVKENGVVTVFLASTTQEGQNKMNWNNEHYGDFITKALTDNNKQTLFDVAVDQFTNVIDTALL